MKRVRVEFITANEKIHVVELNKQVDGFLVHSRKLALIKMVLS